VESKSVSALIPFSGTRTAVAKRTFITLLLFFTALLGTAEAAPKVLALQSVSIAPYEEAIKGFDYILDVDVQRLYVAEHKEKEVLREIQAIKPDLVLAMGRDALLIARRIRTIPVVYCMVLNPLALLRDSNISGVSMNLSPEKQLKELARVFPAARGIGLLYDPEQTGLFVQEVREAAPKLNVKVMATVVHSPGEVPLRLKGMKGKVDIFWMLPDITVITPETVETILLFSLENNIPILTFSEKYLERGAMLSIGIDPFDIGCQAGELAQKILSGKDVGNARRVDARKAVISVNGKIAEKLGFSVEGKTIKGNGGAR